MNIEVPKIHSAVVDRLVADVRPIQRLRPHRLFSVWVLVQGAVLVMVAWRALRPDIGAVVHRPLFVTEVVALAASGTLAAWLTARAAFPGRAPGSRSLAAVAVLGACGMILVVAGRPVGSMSLDMFVTTGSRCFVMTIVIAAAPCLVLLLLVARGASIVPARAGFLAGAAGFLLAAAAMRTACPLDDALHLVVWHGVPVLLGAGVSSLVGAALLGRWASSRSVAERR